MGLDLNKKVLFLQSRIIKFVIYYRPTSDRKLQTCIILILYQNLNEKYDFAQTHTILEVIVKELKCNKSIL